MIAIKMLASQACAAAYSKARVGSLNGVLTARLQSSTASIGADQLKYDIQNIIQPSIDKTVYTQRRLKAFRDTYSLMRRNQLSAMHAENLFVLLYSRYFTTRSMLQQLEGAVDIVLEDDDALKLKFKELAKTTFGNQQDFENAYGDIVKSVKSAAGAAAFDKLTQRLLARPGMSSSALQPLTEVELEVFYLATTETDIYIAENLQHDVAKFETYQDRVLDLLSEYRYVNGWITAGGISLLATVMAHHH